MGQSGVTLIDLVLLFGFGANHSNQLDLLRGLFESANIGLTLEVAVRLVWLRATVTKLLP